jgi:hypothetical protein
MDLPDLGGAGVNMIVVLYFFLLEGNIESL